MSRNPDGNSCFVVPEVEGFEEGFCALRGGGVEDREAVVVAEWLPASPVIV
jgi:hypothetical protein